MISTKWLNGFEDLEDVHMLRKIVFIDEQNVSQDEEFDGTDEQCMHLLVCEDDIPVATGRVLLDGEDFVLGRIAVLKEHRGKQLGDFVVRLLIRKAFESGGDRQTLHAQTYARGFYEKLGFVAYGEEYMEAGIPHVSMERTGDINCYGL